MRKIAIGILSLFFILALLGGVLQSPWGREKAISILTEELSQSGLDIEIGKMEGTLPHHVKIKDLKVDGFGYKVSAGSLEAKLSLLRLLKKEIAFTELNGETISWEKSEAPLGKKEGALPLVIIVEKFKLKDVSIPGKFLSNLEGSLKIGKKYRSAFFDVTGSTAKYPNSDLKIILSLQKDKKAKAKINLRTSTLDALGISHPIDGALSMEANIDGTWGSIFGKESLALSLRGNFHPESVPITLQNYLEKTWEFKGDFIRKSDESWSISKMGVKSDFFTAKGNGSLSSSLAIENVNLKIESDHLFFLTKLPFSGRLFANLDLKEINNALEFETTWRIPVLKLDEYGARNVQGTGKGSYLKGSFDGSMNANFDFLEKKWEALSQFSWTQGNSFFIPEYKINTTHLDIFGNLEIRQDKIISGTTEFTIEQLHDFDNSLYGKGSGKADWAPIERNGEAVQSAIFDMKLFDFYFKELFVEKLSFYSDLADPFQNIQGTISFGMEKGRWGSLFFDSASIETTSEMESWPFQITVDGEWKHPLSIALEGFWQTKGKTLFISFENGDGLFFNHPLFLEKNAKLERSASVFRLNDFSLKVKDASIQLEIEREHENVDAKIAIQKLPLDFLSLNPLDVEIQGIFNLDANLKERGDLLEGNFKTSILNMNVENQELNANGIFEGYFARNLLDLKAKLEARNKPLFDFNLSLPIRLQVWPFHAEMIYDKKTSGHFAMQGKVEDFLDFFDLGTHRIEGECKADFSLSNTIESPRLSGFLNFKNGYYQNYYTGTELKNIQADWLARGKKIILSSFSAEDISAKGTLSAKGRVSLLPKELFPFHFDLDFTKFNSTAFDLMTFEMDGKVAIDGNLEKATAKGSIEVLESNISIPDHIPRKLPDLQVVYKNAIKPPKPPQSSKALEKTPYPLYLDLNVKAPDGIFISGRGLDTEWKGNFKVEGTQTAIESKGSIELIKGEFLFSGRKFKLTEGALSFSGGPNEMPFLNLAGLMEVKDVSITARLKGPLNNPQITLQSVPPLSMGTIMSYLLFGQDMSEINSFQALQLANSLASLAGEGPDVLETTRRSLGVDRLQILNVPDPNDESESTIAVQVGKYVAEGVIVSYSQGSDYSSSNISIEVEIKGGMTFVLESDQAQEQGKFTLRWTHNY